MKDKCKLIIKFLFLSKYLIILKDNLLIISGYPYAVKKLITITLSIKYESIKQNIKLVIL